MSADSTIPDAGSADSSDASVDMEWLSECTDNDPDAMHTLIDMYISRTTAHIEELDAALASGSAADVRRIAHACLGSSGTCGIVKMVPLFRSLEKMGAAGSLAEGPGVALEVHKEFERVKQFLASKDMV